MAKTKFIALKDSDPLALCMKSGTVVLMSDGWRGAVHHDDGKTVLLIKDGERMNAAFKGQRGLLRQPINVRGLRMIGRSQVVDLAARKVLGCAVTVVDRARLESEWNAAPEY